MIFYRHRKYCSFIVDQSCHGDMVEWKKASRKQFHDLPCNLFYKIETLIGEYFNGFDLITVPALSFHTYDHYPIFNVANMISERCGIPIEKLFPNNSGKTKMGTFSGCSKQVQNIDCPPGKFVLILDDIYTTGHTMRVSCEAIARNGSFPVGIAIA